MTAAATVDAYLATQPADRRADLAELRACFLAVAAADTEAIRYGMPAYRLPNGRPIYFATWKQHVSLHDIPPFDGDLEAAVAPFRSGKDTVKFPHRQPLPIALVARILAATAALPG
jgi:uncharacterized protein YdhG (YjbR/CyaY superfamily)